MNFLLMILTTAVFVACNGNGSGSPAGPVADDMSHNELAKHFVRELNLDAEFEVDLVKKSTKQYDFMVIYDPLTDSYDAINIGSFDPNYDNAVDFYFDNSNANYFNLDKMREYYDAYSSICDCYEERYRTVYVDPYTGITFEKTSSSSKDLAKLVAIKEAAQVAKTAKFLSSEFGLSLNRGKEIASLTTHWKKASKKGMANSEIDAFSTELLGFSLTSGIDAYKANMDGDSSALENLVEQSASINGISPEHATKLMTKVFGL